LLFIGWSTLPVATLLPSAMRQSVARHVILGEDHTGVGMQPWWIASDGLCYHGRQSAQDMFRRLAAESGRPSAQKGEDR
jgi:ATP sulfurylase